MHATASLFMPLLDSLVPATDRFTADNRPARPRINRSVESVSQNGENQISLAKLYERLNLLVQLEMPCTISIPSPFLRLRQTLIKSVDLTSEGLTIAGDDFNLQLRESNIHSILLANIGNGSVNRLDIHHSPGRVYASIQPALEGVGEAVWRDVMDNPSLPLF